MTTPPSQHNVGDSGHTIDHNTIATLLAALQTNVAALQAFVETALSDTDNTVTISDQVSWVIRVNLPTGSRGTAPPVIGAYSGTALIAGINAYGELFAGPALPSRPGFVVKGAAGQTAALQQWAASSGAVLAQVNADGSLTIPALSVSGTLSAVTISVSGTITSAGAITAPSVTTGDNWHPLTPGAGWANSGVGPTLQYRKVASPPNSVELIADLNAGTLTNGTVIATLPVAYQPNSNQAFAIAISGAPPTAPGTARCSVNPSGQLQCFGLAGIGSSRVIFHEFISLDA